MRLFIVFVFFFTLSLSANDKTLDNDLALAYGDSTDRINMYRISLKKI